MTDDEQTEKTTDISQPEILSKEEILTTLIQRGVSSFEYKGKNKDELVQLFYKYVCPMPQRKYRQNRRGREMTKSQVIIAKRKRTYHQMTETEQNKKSYTFAASVGNQSLQQQNLPKSGLVNQFNLPSFHGGDRLKPPPVTIDPNKKTVKLGQSKNTSVHSSNGEASAKLSSERKRITFGSSDNTSQATVAKSIDNTIRTDNSMDKIIINSQFKKKTESSVSQGDNHKLKMDTDESSQHHQSNKKVDTNLSQDHPKSAVKIRLKRPVEIKIPTTEEILGKSEIVISGDSAMNHKNSNENTSRDVLSKELKSPTTNKSVISPKQRQLNMINETLKQRVVSDLKGSQIDKEDSSESNGDEVVRKKFKKVCISWP